MRKIKLPVSFRDKRGKIVDLLSNSSVNSATILTFNKNAVRGNHYHKKTTQWNYLISGRIELLSCEPGSRRKSTIMRKGDFIAIAPGEHHTLIALEKSELLVLTKGPRGGKEYKSDTYRARD